MTTKYSKELIEKLSDDPNIICIREDRIAFSLEFRERIYDSLNGNLAAPKVREFFNDNGYGKYNLPYEVYENIIHSFRRFGRPKNGSNANHSSNKYSNSDIEYNDYLVSTGKFKWRGKKHKMIEITEEFFSELKTNYPDQSVIDGLKNAGIDTERFGYQRLYQLENKIDSDQQYRNNHEYCIDTIKKYSDHPYVSSITKYKFSLKSAFYEEARQLKDIDIKDVLSLYEIDSNDLSSTTLLNLKYKLINYDNNTRKRHKKVTLNEQTLRIQYNRMKTLEKLVDDNLRAIGKYELPLMDYHEKKSLCLWISGFKDLDHKPDKDAITVSHVLYMIGMPRSTYYGILRNDDYGNSKAKRDEQDLKDIEVIKQVVDHRKFKKGARQIYMDMKDITGKQFNLKKIRRLMKKFGMTSDIRKRNESAKAICDLIKANKKPNIVKRQFKIARPDSIRLTDVTYLDYNGKRAYASAVKDPVTGRLIDFTVSASNNILLAMESLEHIRCDGINEGTILHSDQGTLYLTDTFQNKVKEYGLIQSMSKRGNCWDNAPQESFFGHFKDEVDYSKCNTLEELITVCDEYKYYYNYERHQWDLKKMTPIQYDAYLKSLSEDEFNEYLRIETVKYEKMKAKAAEKAKSHVECLGV